MIYLLVEEFLSPQSLLQGTLPRLSGSFFYLNLGSTVYNDLSSSIKSGTTGDKYKPFVKNNNFGLGAAEAAGAEVAIQTFNGVETTTVSMGAVGGVGAEVSVDSNGNSSWFWGIDIGAKLAFVFGLDVNLKIGFSSN